ncbi:MAG: anthranilate phosphoribosyltransferase [Beijerinckiaceae bacterium]|nr:anthranilate phosphoribosyltransferase [Beijerinckiaceae bacterium]
MDSFKPIIAKVATGAGLSVEEARKAFDDLLSGETTPSQTGAFLMALRVRGETVEEITGAVSAMRARMVKVKAPANAIDVVGTGGDNVGTYNISTLAAIIVAAVGIPVAKHGNRAASSKSGAADVLSALGIRIDLGPEAVEACIAQAGIGFMMAPMHHPAMRHVGPSRSELGTRTIFNLLGPLSNPAGVRRQMVGTFSKHWLLPIAETLRDLGSEKVWIVHGSDGLDEVTTTGVTHVVQYDQGAISSFDIHPHDAGLPTAKLDVLKGGDAAHNAAALKGVLAGDKNAYRDIAVFNAAAALVVANAATDLKHGAALAAEAVDDGRAAATLAKLVATSQTAMAE